MRQVTRLFFMIQAITISLNTRLIFKTQSIDDYGFIPLPKDKPIGEMIGEDASITTPFGIAVSDGIGGCEFSSAFIARWVVSSMGDNYLTNFHKYIQQSTNIRDLSVDLVQKGIGEMNEFVEASFKACSPVLIGNVANIIKSSDLVSSTTLVSAGLVSRGSENHAMLKIYQKGDSLAVVFRPLEFKGQDGKMSIIYQPIVATEDQQIRFNQPFQFMNTIKKHDKVDNETIDVSVFENDIVILGSDGLFDNLPLSMLTVAVNLIASEIASGRVGIKSFNEILSEFLKEFLTKVTDEREAVVNYFEKRLWKKDLGKEETKKEPKRPVSSKINDKQEAFRETSATRRNAIKESTISPEHRKKKAIQESSSSSHTRPRPTVRDLLPESSGLNLDKPIEINEMQWDDQEDDLDQVQARTDWKTYVIPESRKEKVMKKIAELEAKKKMLKASEKAVMFQNFMPSSQSSQTSNDKQESGSSANQPIRDSKPIRHVDLSFVINHDKQSDGNSKLKLQPRTFEMYQSKYNILDPHEGPKEMPQMIAEDRESPVKRPKSKLRLDSLEEDDSSTFDAYYFTKTNQESKSKPNNKQQSLLGTSIRQDVDYEDMANKAFERVDSLSFKELKSISEPLKTQRALYHEQDPTEASFEAQLAMQNKNNHSGSQSHIKRSPAFDPIGIKKIPTWIPTKGDFIHIKSPLDLDLNSRNVNNRLEENLTDSYNSGTHLNPDYFKIANGIKLAKGPIQRAGLVDEDRYQVPQERSLESKTNALMTISRYPTPVSNYYTMIQRIISGSPQKPEKSLIHQSSLMQHVPHYYQMLAQEVEERDNEQQSKNSQKETMANLSVSKSKSENLSYHTVQDKFEDENDNYDGVLDAFLEYKESDNVKAAAKAFFKKCKTQEIYWEPSKLTGATKLLHDCITRAIKESLALPANTLNIVKEKFDGKSFSYAISYLTSKIAKRGDQFYVSPFWIRAQKSNIPSSMVPPAAKDDDITTTVGLIVNSTITKSKIDLFARKLEDYHKKLKKDLKNAVCFNKRYKYDIFLKKNPKAKIQKQVLI